MARLATNIHLRDERGVVHVFGPDDEVPEWAAQRITNPAAWAEPPSVPAETAPAARRATRRRVTTDADPVQSG